MSRKGFTLSELMLAFALVSLAALVLVGVLTSGLKLMSHSEQHTVAHEVGRELIETTREMGGFAVLPEGPLLFDGRQDDPANSGFPPAPYPEVLVDGRPYQLVVRVEEHPTLAGVRAIQVEVFWGQTGRTVVETAFGG